MELIVINDNSSDNSKDILQSIKDRYGRYNFTIINTDNITGGKGKSNALNIGYQKAKGDFIAIYDADNTPEKTALRYLVQTIVRDESLGAVIGKFRTRNKHKNILTKFINIETLSFQWIAQAGRKQLLGLCTIPGTNFIGKFRTRNKHKNILTKFINIETLSFQWIAQAGRKQLLGLCTIPGTNFVLRRTTIEKLGGWDTKAIAEDTEISFRIYKMGQRITYVPQSVTWEQEPETINVWLKQRTRWVKGNIYVLVKYIKNLFKGKQNIVLFVGTGARDN